MSTVGRPFGRRFSRAEADRFYRPACWHPPEPAAIDPLGALAADFVPDVNRSYEQARRHRHCDLADLSDFELWRERQRATLVAACCEGEPAAWAEQRLKAVAAEQSRRRGRHGR